MVAPTPPRAAASTTSRRSVSGTMLSNWRRQRAQGESTALQARKRGRKADPAVAEARRVQQLQRENDRLRRQLAQAQEIIDVQKKLCNLLGLPTAELPSETE